MNKLMAKVKELDRQYEEVKEEINIIKANGSLSTLYNLKTEFDETFDQFFDSEYIRKKYNDWDYEEDYAKFEKGNSELLEELDSNDLEDYIDFYASYIEVLEEELTELEMKEAFKEI